MIKPKKGLILHNLAVKRGGGAGGWIGPYLDPPMGMHTDCRI